MNKTIIASALIAALGIGYGTYAHKKTDEKSFNADKSVADCFAGSQEVLKRSGELYDQNTALKHQIADRTEQLAAAQKEIEKLKAKRK
jgi:uncharacterized protein HemX